MANAEIPQNYQQLEGSERRPAPDAVLEGPADPNESFDVTISLRRRPDGPPMPSLESFMPGAASTPMSDEEFASKYGASDDDIAQVTKFVKDSGLTLVETNAARRSVVVSGTVAQMNKAFGLDLGRYTANTNVHGHKAEPVKETYRGRDGFIHIPKSLAGIVVGVFGLDNRNITQRNSNPDPPNTVPITVPTLRQLYDYSTYSAVGQTIGIFSLSGYKSSDIHTYFVNLAASGYAQPVLTDVLVHGTNPGSDPYMETTQDIEIAASSGKGAGVNVYITVGSQQGWVDAIHRVAHPSAGDPHCSVLSSSWYISNGDDAATLAAAGISTAFINAVSAAFQDAAIQGITVCIASGDTGSNSKENNGKAHVQYPGSDPWVLCVGGTTVGNIIGTTFNEYVWNDPSAGDPSHWGTTGGGISDFFALPSYQVGKGVPHSVNPGAHVGRGVPDVAANASFHSGYKGIIWNGNLVTGNGTSGSAPLWAGFIAVINAAIGHNIGFANPTFYSFGSGAFNDIVPGLGPVDNSNGGVPGYPAHAGWDACTGWGSPNGMKLLAAFQQAGWRWCHKCQGMFFILNSSGSCPAGGPHDMTGSGKYAERIGESGTGQQGGWRWCHKCQGLYFDNTGAGAGQGVCPTGGTHSNTGSGHYAAVVGNGVPGQQSGWRWCHKCQGMYYDGTGAGTGQGVCPAGGAHSNTGSGQYASIVSQI